MKIGKKLKSLRSDQGIGIKKLAGHLAVDYSYLSKIENDKANPSRETISRMAHYFKCNEEELLVLSEKLPVDIEKILKEHPVEAIKYLRRRFGS